MKYRIDKATNLNPLEVGQSYEFQSLRKNVSKDNETEKEIY